jgi:hypothetical protein
MFDNNEQDRLSRPSFKYESGVSPRRFRFFSLYPMHPFWYYFSLLSEEPGGVRSPPRRILAGRSFVPGILIHCYRSIADVSVFPKQGGSEKSACTYWTSDVILKNITHTKSFRLKLVIRIMIISLRTSDALSCWHLDARIRTFG